MIHSRAMPDNFFSSLSCIDCREGRIDRYPTGAGSAEPVPASVLTIYGDTVPHDWKTSEIRESLAGL
jgi:hypothetical protein